ERRGSIAERDNPALAIHKHGDFRVRQNFVRFAADHESRYPAPAVGGHEDYVAASFRRSLDNLLPRMVTDLVDHLVGDPGQLGRLLSHPRALTSEDLRLFYLRSPRTL